MPEPETAPVPNPTPDGAVNNPGAPVAGVQPTPAAPQGGQQPPASPVSWTPEQMQAIENMVKARLDRDRQERDERMRADAAKKAGEFEKLYTELEPKHKALETEVAGLRKERDTFAQFVGQVVDTETKEWPEMAKLADPGPDDPAGRVQWYLTYRPVVTKAEEKKPDAPAPATPGAFAPPPASDGKAGAADAQQQQASLYRRAW